MIFEKLNQVRERIAQAAKKAGRKANDVELLAVTKYASVEAVQELARCGIHRFGESRVQDALKKSEALAEKSHEIEWRFIGHLQRNKVRHALTLFSALDSLDNLELAERLQRELEKHNKILPVLCQVKIAEKETQSGIAPEHVDLFLSDIRKLPNLRANGLMVIAPMTENIEETRPHFRKMHQMFKQLFPEPFHPGEGPYLSMGMSRDYEIAVEEGSNLVRIGSALFE